MAGDSSDINNLMLALAHKIRTPLSIIQNELVCIKPQISDEEYERLLKACKNINAILKESPAKLILEAEVSNSGKKENE